MDREINNANQQWQDLHKRLQIKLNYELRLDKQLIETVKKAQLA
jgi:hypothetical protein